MYIVVGLGNPGSEYEHTRHNTGRMALEYICSHAQVRAKFLAPDTFMNKSGPAVAKALAGKSAKNLIVIHDDLDLALGTMKIVFDRGSGGHKGVESIIRAIKTQKFIRIRIGIVPATPAGKLKKPKGEREVEKFILGEFKKPEMETLKKVFKHATEAVELITEGELDKARTEFNK